MTDPEAICVSINLTEIERAAITGMERWTRELEAGAYREDGWDLYINAAIGELVIAKVRGQGSAQLTEGDKAAASIPDEEPNPSEQD